MPEVVEVAITAAFLDKKLRNKTMIKMDIHGGRYSRHELKGKDLIKSRLPMKIVKVDSKGKFMWIELEKGQKKLYIMNTYGLEGQWGFTKMKHSGVSFTIKNKKNKVSTVYFTDSRNFGTIQITDDIKLLNKKLNMLAPDFLKTTFTDEEFYQRIKNYVLKKDGTINKQRANKEIIKVLMEQKKSSGLGSGLGNYLSVDALFIAKISPYRKMLYLYKNPPIARKLSKSIKTVVKLAFFTADIGYLSHLDPKMDKFVKNLRSDIKNDKNHTMHYHPDTTIGRKKYKFLVYRQKKDPFGNEVSGDKIIKGRTTYWSPKVQK